MKRNRRIGLSVLVGQTQFDKHKPVKPILPVANYSRGAKRVNRGAKGLGGCLGTAGWARDGTLETAPACGPGGRSLRRSASHAGSVDAVPSARRTAWKPSLQGASLEGRVPPRPSKRQTCGRVSGGVGDPHRASQATADTYPLKHSAASSARAWRSCRWRCGGGWEGRGLLWGLCSRRGVPCRSAGSPGYPGRSRVRC